MKATGIVRRIDELGRVVIPKEIRRTLRIKEGDPLEIFTDRDELMLKKYSPIATLERFSEATARSLNDLSGKLAAICDTDEILYAYGEGKRDLDKKQLSEEMAEELSRALSTVGAYSTVRIEFYSHGHYLDLEGLVKEKDSVFRFLKIGNEKIYFDDILRLRVI